MPGFSGKPREVHTKGQESRGREIPDEWPGFKGTTACCLVVSEDIRDFGL